MTTITDQPDSIQGSWARTADGRPATKTIAKLADGSIKIDAYAHGLHWYFENFSYPSLECFQEALKKKLDHKDTMMIYGRLRHGLVQSLPHCRRWANPDPQKNTLIAGERGYIVGDVDKASVPIGLGSADKWKKGALWVKDNLAPPSIRNARWLIIPSASTGQYPDNSSFRFFVKIKWPALLSDIKKWALGAKRSGYAVDDSVFQIGQPIYITRPCFIGFADPLLISGELSFITSGNEYAQIDLTEFNAASAAWERDVGFAVNYVGSDWIARLHATLGGNEGFYSPLKRACRAAVGAGVNEEEWLSIARVALDNSSKGSSQRIAAYTDKELLRMFTDFHKYEVINIRLVKKALSSLGL